MKRNVWMACVAAVAVFVAQSTVAEAARPAPRTKRYDNAYQAPARATGMGMGAGHKMAGCGLGSMVVETSDKWSQVGAAFLNGTGMQTFAISFGTSNCTEDGLSAANKEKDAFVEANFMDLRRDVAAGEGEYLASLASLYGCRGDSAKNFANALRAHQDVVFQSTPEQATGVINGVVALEKVGCGA